MVRRLLRQVTNGYPAVLGTLGILVLVVLALYGTSAHAPLQLSHTAWTTIRHTETEQASYATDVLISARDHYDRAWAEIHKQLQRPAPFRSFERATILLLQSIGLAEAAKSIGNLTKEQERRQMAQRVAVLRHDLNRFSSELHESLKSMALRTNLVRAEIKVSLAEQHLADTDPPERFVADAVRAVAEFRAALDSEYRADSAMLPVWNDWARETIAWTEQTDSAAVLVVKSTHCGYLLASGMVISSFPIELGYRPGRQKMHSGDGATPEGRFRIVARRDTGAAYYRALDIDYPTFADSIRYYVGRKLGTIADSLGIGGSIQIHGEGGRSTDWTDGCVAVTNEQMDRLMEHLDVGDRVTIVRQLDGWP